MALRVPAIKPKAARGPLATYLPAISPLLILGLAAALRAWNLFNVNYVNYDEGCYISDALMVLRGKIPARDFTTKTILLIYLLALVMKPLGVGLFQGRLVPAVSGVLITAILYLLGKKALGKGAGLLASLIYALSFNAIKWNSVVKTETLATLFALSSVYAFVMAYERRSKGWLALSGVLAACASLTRLTSLIVLTYVALLLLDGLWYGRTRENLKALGILMAGFAAVCFCVLFPLVMLSSPSQVYFVFVGQNIRYYMDYFGSRGGFPSQVTWFMETEFLSVVGTLAFLIILAGRALLRREIGLPLKVLTSWLAFLVAQMCIVGALKIHATYLAQLLPVMALMTAESVSVMLKPALLTGRRRSEGGPALGDIALIVFLTFLTLSFVYALNYIGTTPDYLGVARQENPEIPVFRVAQFIRERTGDADEVFTATPIYVVLAGRRLPLDLTHPMILIHIERLTEEERRMMNMPSTGDLLSYLKSPSVKFVVRDFYMGIVWRRLPESIRAYVDSNFVGVDRIGSVIVLQRQRK